MSGITITGSLANFPVPSSEEFVHQWIKDNKTISIFRKGNLLECQVFDHLTKKSYRGPVEKIRGVTIDRQIAFLLKKGDPQIDANGKVSFKVNGSIKNEWDSNWNGKKIYLLEKDGKLSWQLFDSATKSIYRAAFEMGHYHILNIMPDPIVTDDFVYDVDRSRYIYKKTSEGQIHYAWDKAIIPFDTDFKEDSDQPFDWQGLSLEKVEVINNQIRNLIFMPFHVVSHFHQGIFITREEWAVTLINTNGKSIKAWHGHAALIIETLDENGYRMYFAHLRLDHKKTFGYLPGTVVCYIKNRQKLRYKEKYETWIRKKDLVKKLLYEIEKQIQEQVLGKTAVFFNAKGSQTIFSANYILTEDGKDAIPIHNCITWANSMLKFVNGKHPLQWGQAFITPKGFKKALKLEAKQVEKGYDSDSKEAHVPSPSVGEVWAQSDEIAGRITKKICIIL